MGISNLERVRNALVISAELKQFRISLTRNHYDRLSALSYRPAWTKSLIAIAEAIGAHSPRGMVAQWLMNDGWIEQMLYLGFTKFGLWRDYSNGGRFNLCRRLARAGVPPWILFDAIKAVEKVDHILKDPPAYLSELLRNGHILRFIEYVERRGRKTGRSLDVGVMLTKLAQKVQV